MTLSFRRSALAMAVLGGATLLSAPAFADYIVETYDYPPPAYVGVAPAYPEPFYAPPPYAEPVIVDPELAVAPPPPYEYAPEPFVAPDGAIAIGID